MGSLRGLTRRFSDAFEKEAARRDAYEGLEWIEQELQFMAQLVADELTHRGLSTAGVSEEVRAAEERARGHIDYGSKWASACAEIVATRSRVGTSRG